MDDYYSLLGVDADAKTEDIRSAYREKRAALNAGDSSGVKTDAARLNKAWNVLSDPYQRGRYDEQRAQAEEDGKLDDVDGIESAPASPRARRQATNRQRAREMPPPTIELPPGTAWPENRQRLVAMSIDLSVLFALFAIALFVVIPAIAKNQHPAAYDRSRELHQHELPDARKAASDADKKADSAESKAKESGSASDKAAAKKARADADAKKKHQKALEDELAKVDKTLAPVGNSVMGGFFLVGALYLIVPSALTGRTLGKRFQRLKVLRQDGSRLRWTDATVRYGLVVLVTLALFVPLKLGPIGAAIVIIGVTTWMRNQNHQGLHDRLAKTIVVADEA